MFQHASVGNLSALEFAFEGAPERCATITVASSVTVLAEFADLDAAAMLIDDDLGFLGSQADAHEHLADVVNRARVFAGHAGWEPGQLEAEMEEESWIVEPALREDVFTEDPEGLWSSLLRRKGGEYIVIATMPDDPTLN